MLNILFPVRHSWIPAHILDYRSMVAGHVSQSNHLCICLIFFLNDDQWGYVVCVHYSFFTIVRRWLITFERFASFWDPG
ncbi:hypothetical protein AB3S75_022431 [Citrus x aurantiifolia]